MQNVQPAAENDLCGVQRKPPPSLGTGMAVDGWVHLRCAGAYSAGVLSGVGVSGSVGSSSSLLPELR